MLKTIKQFFAPPVFADEDKNRIASILNGILLLLFAFIVLLILLAPLFSLPPILLNKLWLFVGVVVATFLLMRFGGLKIASFLLPLFILALTHYGLQVGNGLRSYTVLSYGLVLVMSSLLLGRQGIIISSGLSAVSFAVLFFAETSGYIIPNFGTTVLFSDLLIASLILIFSAVILDIMTSHLLKSLEQARTNEQALTKANAKLQTNQALLQEQVIDRTSGLEIVAILSERLNAILDLDDLLIELVTQVKKQFDYYHAHIYLLDNTAENLVVAEGTGEAGAAMKAQGHNIPLTAPTSLVARAARTSETVWFDNVRDAKDWLPNPLLPNTRSEMAVPIILEKKVVGVLDIQQDQLSALDNGDANVLRFLANQVAVAIRNAQLFTEVETALTEAQAIQERYLIQAWQKGKVIKQGGYYHYNHPNALPLDKIALIKAKQKTLEYNQPTVSDNEDGEQESMLLLSPVILRDKAIGTLQLYPTSDKKLWSKDDLMIVEAVVDELAQIAENLRLFDETRERASREESIREIAAKLQAAPTLDRLVTVATEELGRHLAASHAKLTLGL